MSLDPRFSQMNKYALMEFIAANSPEELQEQVRKIHVPMEVVAMYPQGGKHFMWFIAPQAKIERNIKKRGRR